MHTHTHTYIHLVADLAAGAHGVEGVEDSLRHQPRDRAPDDLRPRKKSGVVNRVCAQDAVD